MKIARIQSFLCDAGWRPWIFVKVETDDGLVGWGECSDGRNPHGVVGRVRDYEPVLLGQDPRAVERLYWDMHAVSRQNLGGVSHKAMAGIELALWDLKAKALDVAMVDVPWNGFTPSRRIADLAEVYEVNVAPHNYYSHLATHISANLCAVTSNVRIMEIDIDDVPWKDDLVTTQPEIRDGSLTIPTGPGWGAAIEEAVLAAHPWPPGRWTSLPAASSSGNVADNDTLRR